MVRLVGLLLLSSPWLAAAAPEVVTEAGQPHPLSPQVLSSEVRSLEESYSGVEREPAAIRLQPPRHASAQDQIVEKVPHPNACWAVCG